MAESRNSTVRAGQLARPATGSNGSGNSQARIIWQAPQRGEFFIRVWPGASSQEGTYSLRVLSKYDERASWDGDGEPDDVWVLATPMGLNQTVTRSLYQRGPYSTAAPDQDTFRFTAQAGYRYTATLSSTASTLRANLYLLSLDGSTILASDER